MWQSRFFRLYTDCLQYYKGKKDAAPAGTIPSTAMAVRDVFIATDLPAFMQLSAQLASGCSRACAADVAAFCAWIVLRVCAQVCEIPEKHKKKGDRFDVQVGENKDRVFAL
jgi:hypothetical protein